MAFRRFLDSVFGPSRGRCVAKDLGTGDLQFLFPLAPFDAQLLLGFLPTERASWDAVRRSQRLVYEGWKRELVVDPVALSSSPAEAPATHTSVAADANDHPLASTPGSVWHAYFQNEELYAEIGKDVSRTLPDYGFYSEEQPGGQVHRNAILEILFVYARLNPGIRYVQGMNELLAPIYFIVAQHAESELGHGTLDGDGQQVARQASAEAEAVAFFCFTALMAETRDRFCESLDHTTLGVTGTMGTVSSLLAAADAELAAHLGNEKVAPQFYAFRWVTLLCSQEFDLPDVLRLWDSLFADDVRFDFLLHFCVSMLVTQRDVLLRSTFPDIVKRLQRAPEVDLGVLLQTAQELYAVARRPAAIASPESTMSRVHPDAGLRQQAPSVDQGSASWAKGQIHGGLSAVIRRASRGIGANVGKSPPEPSNSVEV